MATKQVDAQEGIEKRLVRALRHPLRVELLRQFTERTASPNELAVKLDEDLSYLSYHVRELEKAGAIELVKTEPKRGAVEHFYRGTARAHFSDKDWEQLPEDTRAELSCRMLQAIFGEAFVSLESGTLDARLDRHVTWQTMLLDVEGWQEAMDLLLATMNELAEIQARSDQRRAESAEEGIPVLAALLGFERPELR